MAEKEIKQELQSIAIQRLLRHRHEIGKNPLTGKPAIKLKGINIGLKQWSAIDCLVNYFGFVCYRE